MRSIFERRRDGHWVNAKLASNSSERLALLCCYQALEAAGDFLVLCEQYSAGFTTISGTGKLKASGSIAREPVNVAFDYFKANAGRISASIHPTEKDFHLHLVEMQSSASPDASPDAITLASFIALCSAALGKPIQSQMVVMGDMSLGGTITPARNLAETLQVAFDAGAKRILLPMSSVVDIPSVPGELFAKFQTGFYSDPVDAVFKALGVD